jgi:hypothetical protein
MSARNVEFWSSDFIGNRQPTTGSVDANQLATPFIEEPPTYNPNCQFIGWCVVVMGKKHGFKNYYGIVKDALNDGFVTIKLEATMRWIRVEMNKLAVRYDGIWLFLSLAHDGVSSVNGKFVPLNVPQPQQCFVENPGLSTSQISAPLTPLPSTWSSSSPAWDPSSRTPIPLSTYPLVPSTPLLEWMQPISHASSSRTPGTCVFSFFAQLLISCSTALNPWFMAIELGGKRLKAQVTGTSPVLRDPGFRHGDLEGKQGIIVGRDNDGAMILFSLGDRIHVPSQYVCPIPPTVVAQNVTVISGTLVGKEYTVVKYGLLECGLKKRNQRGTKVDETLPTRSLSIVL